MIALIALFVWPFLIARALLASLTGYGEELAVEGPVAKMLWLGLFKTLFEATELTVEAKTGQKKFEITGSEGKGFKNGKLVYLREINKKATKGEKVLGNFILARAYYVVGATANTFELALQEGGTGIEIETEGAKVGAAEHKIVLLEEVTEGANYKRSESKFVKTALGAKQPSLEWAATEGRKVKVPAGTTVTYSLWGDKEKTSEGKIWAVEILTASETFNENGEYEFTKDQLEYIIGAIFA